MDVRNVKFMLWEIMYHVNISVLIKLLQYIRYWFWPYHYANTPMQYTTIFYCCKNVHFQMNFFFLIFAENIDCEYTLEPPQRGGSNECPQSNFWSKNKKKYTPVNPSFTIYIKVGCKGVFVTRTCFGLTYDQFCIKVCFF